MSRQLAICCAVLAGAGLSLANAPIARAQQPAVQVVNRQTEIKTKLVYNLAGLIKPTAAAVPPTEPLPHDTGSGQPAEPANAPNPPANQGDIHIVVIGPQFRRIIDQPALKQPPPENARDLHELNGRKVHWKGYRTLDDMPGDLKPNVIYFLRDDPSIQKKLENLPARLNPPAPVLIITEQDDKWYKQAAVNLYEDKAANRIRIQLRKSSLKARGLEADPELLKLDGVVAN